MKNNLLSTFCLLILWAFFVSLPISAKPTTSEVKANSALFRMDVSNIEKSGRSYTLPFIENWSMGTFEHQDWTFENYSTNWRITGSGGNAPYAQFRYQPRLYNYNSSLISPMINIEDIENLELSLDLYFSGYMYTETEYFKIFILDNNNWVELDSFSNIEDIEWTTLTYNLNTLQGTHTQIKFEVSGEDTDRYNNWNIDNIILEEQSQGVASFELLPAEYDFGDVNIGETSNPATFTLTNSGTAAGTVNTVNITGADAASFSIIDLPELPLEINVNQGLNLDMVFSPDQTGEYSAQLMINTTNGEFSANVSGTAIGQTVYSLPFIETWDEANFEHQDWTFENYSTNWRITGSGGNAPYAQFHYQPRLYNYNSSLISPMINIEDVENLELSLDLYFSGYMYTETEYFKIFILDNNNWIELDSFSNIEDIEWTTLTYDLNTLQGTHTQIKFEVSGEDSNRYNNWNIDNIILEEQGQGVASFELLPAEYDFGDVNIGETSNPATFTLTNSGTAAGTVNTVNITGADAASFSIIDLPELPLEINVNQGLNLDMVFSPDQTGEYSAQLIISTTNGEFSANVSGTAIGQTVYNLPFIETWDEANFEHQDWTFENYSTNWRITGSGGNAPYAQFHYQPRLYNYNSSLISPMINIEDVENLELSLDLYFSGYMYTETEYFKIFILDNNNWIELDSFSNIEDIEWTTLTYDLNTLQGTHTQIKFEVSGEDSNRYNNWNIDNIILDGIFLYAFELTPESADFGEIMTGTVSAPKTFTYTNTGTLDLLINGSSIIGEQADAYILNDSQQYPILLEVGQSKELSVQFAPQFEGTANAELLITTDFQDFSSQLTGHGYNEFIGTIPFNEDWSSGSFDTQQWIFDQEQTNWRIQTNSGNPAPAARFNFSPIVNDYSYSLISPRIQIPTSTQQLILSYDLKLTDFQSEGTEWLKMHIWDGQDWQQITEVSNTGNTDWVFYQFDISEYVTQETRIRFEATGSNSSLISNWEVDNISLQSVDWPKIAVEPLEMIQSLMLGETITEQLLITNEGGSTLSFDANIVYDEPTGGENWLQLSQHTGDIEAGGTLPIDVTFTAEGMQEQGDTFTSQIRIASNDPDQPEIVIQATLSILVSLNEVQVLNIKVYPNPVKETLYCIGIEDIRRIKLFNSLGQCIYEHTTNGKNSHVIDVSTFQSGVYLIHMITESNNKISNTILINK